MTSTDELARLKDALSCLQDVEHVEVMGPGGTVELRVAGPRRPGVGAIIEAAAAAGFSPELVSTSGADRTTDAVDEAGDETFPASDPPSFTPSTVQ